jgi:hypothetical protein
LRDVIDVGWREIAIHQADKEHSHAGQHLQSH